MRQTLSAIFLVAFTAFFMIGCAGMRLLDNDVTSFYNWGAAPPAPGTAYRFERLPSQQAIGSQQGAVEGRTRSALAKVGLELNPAAARYSVQVVLGTQVVERSPYGGYDGFGFATPGVFLGAGNQGGSVGLSFPIGGYSSSYYRRELTLLIRDLTTSQVVYETHSLSDGVQGETLDVSSAMLDAALRGFPQPPPGPRRISVQIPR